MPIPLLAAAFSAVAPQLAQKGLDLLSGIFRGAVDKGADQVATMIKEKTGINIQDAADNKLTQDQWAKLKQFEFEYQGQLLEFRKASAQQELEMEKLRVEDTKNARAAAVERDKNDDQFISRFTYYYAYLITGMTFLFIFIAILAPAYLGSSMPPESWRVIDTVLGFLLGVGLSAIIQFFYGSSQGSKDKAKELDKLNRERAAADAAGQPN
jgi:hypothetical protein